MKKNASALVHFERMYVNSIANAGGVFVGANTQHGWSSHEKENEGLGIIFGNLNSIHENINVLLDNDMIDAPITDPDLITN